jgi:hypothetical protein
MRHSPPGVILGRRLREPYVARTACELGAFEGADDCVPIANLTAAALTRQAPRFIFESRLPLKRLSVSGWSGALMVTTSQTLTMSSTPECQARPPLFLNRLEEAMSIMKTHVEGLQSAEYAKADAAARNRADVRAPDIVGLATQSAMFQPPSPPTGKRE